MYSTCLFCNKPLGTNEVLEIFPVGRRIAFDADRGRLWVVCKACERWNLSPLDERWEVVEECERLFRDARLRTSTENIGLARLREGLDLVRIGAPQRPEFAAWRYGDQFGRRRRMQIMKTGLGVAAIGAFYAGLSLSGVGIGSFAYLGINSAKRALGVNPDKKIMLIPDGYHTLDIRQKHLSELHIVRHDDTGWALRVPSSLYKDSRGNSSLGLAIKDVHTVSGEAAENAIRVLLPAVNRFGGSQKRVTEAVKLLEKSDPQHYIAEVARQGGRYDAPSLTKLPWEVRLALEMSTHEEAERRALEGELHALEAEWKNAEEIASIADDLLTPAAFDAKLQDLRRKD